LLLAAFLPSINAELVPLLRLGIKATVLAYKF